MINIEKFIITIIFIALLIIVVSFECCLSNMGERINKLESVTFGSSRCIKDKV